MRAKRRLGVVCMAYGSPRDEAAVRPYLKHVRGGREPSPALLEDLVRRYQAIGFSPLNRITRAQAAAISKRVGVPAFVGMKHAPPFIADAVDEARANRVTQLVGLPLAPHFAAMSVGAYERALRETWDGPLTAVRGFHAHPSFVAAVQEVLAQALTGYEADLVVFTAHSLPARIAREGDDYPGRLAESCRLVAAGMRLPPWRWAFQSASATGEPWFGPDLLEVVEASGARRILVCPIGFVADHLEVLYDLDIEARAHARRMGVELRRTASLNDRPAFIEALVSIVREAVALEMTA